jgi:hypothetical protein
MENPSSAFIYICLKFPSGLVQNKKRKEDESGVKTARVAHKNNLLCPLSHPHERNIMT